MLDSTRTSRLTIASIAVILLLGPGAAGSVWAQLSDGERVFEQSCVSCHNGAIDSRAPGLDALRARTPQAVIESLMTGAMRPQGSRLSGPERRAVAEFVTGKKVGGDVTGGAKQVNNGGDLQVGGDLASGANMNGGGDVFVGGDARKVNANGAAVRAGGDVEHTNAKDIYYGGAIKTSNGTQHAGEEMPFFAQEIFEQANAKGPLTDKAYIAARDKARRLAGPEGIDAALKKQDLDALVAPAMSPAWPTDPINGDHFVGAGYGAAAVARYPSITVPMGAAHGLPLGIAFMGPAWSEARLIELAYAYEQATRHRRAPPSTPPLQ